MSGKHVSHRISAELGNVVQAGELAVCGRWVRSTVRFVGFSKDFEGFRETVSGHGLILGWQGITMAGMLFSQGFSMDPGGFLLCPNSSK